MKQAQVLIVDTDIELYNRTVSMWADYGIQSHQVDTIALALEELSRKKFHLIVIVEHKEMREAVLSSLKLFRELSMAQLVIASHDPIDKEYKIAGFDMGADDVWEMPKHTEEAISKGNALIRRYIEWNSKTLKQPTLIINQQIILSTEQRLVFVKGKQTNLKRKEFDILRLLVSYPGHVFTYEQVFRDVWGEDYVDNSKNILWNHIKRLRDTIQIEDDLPEFIKTVHGVGYSFDPQTYNI